MRKPALSPIRIGFLGFVLLAWVLLTFPSSSSVQQWAKTYGGSGDDGAFSIQQTRDGGYIVAGWTTSFGSGGDDVWVLKLKDNGDVEWQRTYGGSGDDRAYSIQQTNDGGYIVAGRTTSFGAGTFDAWVLKLDANGNIGDCSAVGTSNATVNDTNASEAITNLPNSTTSATINDTDAVINSTYANTTTVCSATSYTLTINKRGSGTVVSIPPGIDCSSTCSASFSSGTSVTLTATPDAGSTFAGWSGDCSSCGTNSTCTITMNANKTCTATFNTASSGGGGSGGGGGGCSMSYGANPLNALVWLLVPAFVLARRLRRR